MQNGKPSLKSLLAQHTSYDEQIRSLTSSGTVDSLEIQELKKKKLAVRDAIVDGDFDRRSRITRVDLHPLSNDTLELLRQRLKGDLDSIGSRVNHTSGAYVSCSRELRAVEVEQQSRRDGTPKPASLSVLASVM